MKIAIIGSFDYHLECIPFILESYKDDSISIIINKNSDKYNWIDYLHKLHKNIRIYYGAFIPQVLTQHDKVIKISSNDRCIEHPKIISLLHIIHPGFFSTSDKYLILTPVLKYTDKWSMDRLRWSGWKKPELPNLTYTFPVFNPDEIIKHDNKVVTLIGYYKNSDVDADTQKFIESNSDYTFNFICWGDNATNYTNVTKYPNGKWYSKIPTLQMIDIIKNSKYILSKKYINYDRFSGQLGIAASFEKPLIIDEKTQKIYNLPGIPFKKNYTEVGKLSDINDEKYEELVSQTKEFKMKIIEENRKLLQSI